MPRAVAESDGPDATYLTSEYGLTPDDWQEDALVDWLGRRRDGRWAAGTCGYCVPRQNGKNGIIEARELYGMVVLGEKFLHTAHEVKTARKAFLRIVSFFENERRYPELFELVKDIRKTNGQEAVILTNGGSVEFVARSKGSGRGFTVDVLVLDEAQDLTDEELEALLPTISSAPLRNPQIILTGTPPDPDKGQVGEVFTRVRQDADKGRDPRLAFTDYGVPDGPLDGIDLDDIGLLYQTNPALASGRMQVEVCRTERRRMSAAGYARERLGWWGNPTGGENVEGALLGWKAAGNGSLVEPERVQALGISVSLDRDWGSLGSAGFTDDDRTFLGAVRREVGTHWLVDEAARIQSATGCIVAIDGGGPAKNLIPALEEAGVDLTILDTSDACDAYADLLDGIKNKTHVHARHPELDDAVRVTKVRSVGKRSALGTLPGEDAGMAEAAMYAAWAAHHGDAAAVSVHGFGQLDLCDRCQVNPHEDPDGDHDYLCSTCREEAP